MEKTDTNQQTPQPGPMATPPPRSGTSVLKIVLSAFGTLIALVGLATAYVFLYLGRVEITAEPAANLQLGSGGVTKNIMKKTFRTSPGQKTITASKDGYVKESHSVTVRSGKVAALRVELSGVPKFSQLTEGRATWLTVSQDGTALYYLSAKGQGQAFYKVTLATGKQEQISTERLAGITEVKWSPNRNQAILKVQNDASLRGSGSVLYRADLPNGVTTNWVYDFRRYNFVSQEPSQLELSYVNTQIGDLAWSPDGAEIAYVFSTTSGKRTLNIAKPDFGDFRTVTDIPNAGARLAWSPDGKRIALYYQRGSTLVSEQGAVQPEDTNLYLVDVVTRALTKVTEGGNVTGALWSPDSTRLLFSEGQNSSLKLYSLSAKTSRDTGVRSLVTKSVWAPDGQAVYVAAPADTGSLGTAQEKDVLFKVPSGGSTNVELAQVSEAVGRITNDLATAPDGQTLYFTDPTGVGKATLAL